MLRHLPVPGHSPKCLYSLESDSYRLLASRQLYCQWVLGSLLGFVVGPPFPVILNIRTSMLPPATRLSLLCQFGEMVIVLIVGPDAHRGHSSSAGSIGAGMQYSWSEERYPHILLVVFRFSVSTIANTRCFAISLLGVVFVIWRVIITWPWEPITIAYKLCAPKYPQIRLTLMGAS
jgi:hypothetical protein